MLYGMWLLRPVSVSMCIHASESAYVAFNDNNSSMPQFSLICDENFTRTTGLETLIVSFSLLLFFYFIFVVSRLYRLVSFEQLSPNKNNKAYARKTQIFGETPSHYVGLSGADAAQLEEVKL